MFFTLTTFTDKKTKIYHTLPVFMHNTSMIDVRSFLYSVGTISHTSSAKASLTIEATLVFPFFILVIFSLMYFINIITLQTTLQIQLEECSRKINSFAYTKETSSDTAQQTEFLTLPLIYSYFFSDEVKQLCDENSYIQGGHYGISFLSSKFDTKKGDCQLQIKYTIKLPFIPGNIIKISLSQKCHFKLFNGEQLSSSISEENPIVYITAHGSVYHKNKYCSYLIKYTDVINIESLSSYEIKKNKKLMPCTLCQHLYSTATIIYISRTGNSYHYSRDCHYLTNDIYEYHYNDVKNNYPACSRCG